MGGPGGPRAPPEIPAGEDPPSFLLDLADRVTEADRWSVLVEHDDQLVVLESTDEAAIGTTRSGWRGLVGQAHTTSTACVIDDALDTRSVAADATSTPDQSPRSLCCVPIEGVGMLLGEARRPGAFEEEDLVILQRFVDALGDSLSAYLRLRAIPDGGRRPGDVGEDHAEEIADILSHDLMSPLNVARGNVELAMETGDDVYLERALQALERIEELVDEVVLIATTGDRIDRVEPVDLETAARAAWTDLGHDECTLEIDSTATLDAGEQALRHLLENLLDNAVEHGGRDVTVRVGLTDRGFYVEDDGPGIPESLRERVFDRGFSLDRASSGLGLHIVSQIVDAHGWSIGVTEAEDGGTRFEIDTAPDDG